MTSLPSSRILLLFCALLGLSGCATDPYTGNKHFNPWKAAQNLDNSIDDWMDKRNAGDNYKERDFWNQ